MPELVSGPKNGRKSLEDVKHIDDMSYDKLDALRGDTPLNIKEKCLKLCQDYLGSVWLEQTVHTIQLRRISGGMTNQVYYCSVAQPSNEGVVPEEVAIRLYERKYFNNEEKNERFNDNVIALLVSKIGLGPKIYGIFEQGQIQAFYKVFSVVVLAPWYFFI